MATKKNRQTFEKLRREQAVRDKRVRKQERREAARQAKASNETPDGSSASADGGVELETPDNGATAADGGGTAGDAPRDEP